MILLTFLYWYPTISFLGKTVLLIDDVVFIEKSEDALMIVGHIDKINIELAKQISILFFI